MLTINYSKFYYSPMPRLLIIPALSSELARKGWRGVRMEEDGKSISASVFSRTESQKLTLCRISLITDKSLI